MCANSVVREASIHELIEVCREVVNAGGVWQMTVTGQSMAPTIPSESTITLKACPQPPPLGSIVLAQNAYAIVVHRVLRRKVNSVLLIGDANSAPDTWFPVDQVVGQVIAWHNNDTIYHEGDLHRWWQLTRGWLRYLHYSIRSRLRVLF